MMLALVVSAVLAADVPARPLAIIISSRRAGSGDIATAVATQLREELAMATEVAVLSDAEAAKAIKRDARECNAVAACLAGVAKVLGPKAMVVGVDVARLRGKVAVYLEAVTPDQQTIHTADFSVAADSAEAMTRALQKFAAGLAEKVVTAPPPSVAGTVPSAPVLTPRQPPPSLDEPRETTSAIVTQPPRQPSPMRWVLIGVAGAAAVVAVVLGIVGLTQRSAVEKSLYCDAPVMLSYADCPVMQRATRLTRPEYDRLSASTNTSATASLLLGVVAGLAGVASIPFFLP